jgi:HEAT repeat protein
MDPATHVRAAAVEALGQIGKSMAQNTSSPDVQNQANRRLVEILAPLATATDSEEDVVRTAISGLGELNHPDAVKPLLTLLTSSSPARRINALEILANFEDARVVPAIQDLLDRESEIRVVNVAIQTLANLSDRKSTEVLINLMGNSQYRESVIAALAGHRVVGHRSQSTESMPTTEEEIQWIGMGLRHRDPSVRSGLVEVLTRFKHPLASELLVIALDDRDASVRLSCMRALAHLGHRGIEEKLQLMTRNDPNARVRRAAQKVLQDLA